MQQNIVSEDYLYKYVGKLNWNIINIYMYIQGSFGGWCWCRPYNIVSDDYLYIYTALLRGGAGVVEYFVGRLNWNFCRKIDLEYCEYLCVYIGLFCICIYRALLGVGAGAAKYFSED